MNSDEQRTNLNEITNQIIGCAYEIGNGLGQGFVEKVYENALAHLLRKAGHTVEQQHGIQVWFDSVVVGEFQADLLVDGCVIVELKAVKNLDEVHMAQCLNYLRATGLQLCLLINFGGPRVEVKRIVNRF